MKSLRPKSSSGGESWNGERRTLTYFTLYRQVSQFANVLKQMEDALTADQKKAAMELLKSGLSAKGYEQATTIIGLENLLLELEGPKGAMTRNSNWYFVSVFGEPSNTGKWGWRFEGHHLSVNYTLDKGEVGGLRQIETALHLVFQWWAELGPIGYLLQNQFRFEPHVTDHKDGTRPYDRTQDMALWP